jgi:hypothetical protein
LRTSSNVSASSDGNMVCNVSMAASKVTAMG